MNDKPKKGSRLAIIDYDRILQRILSTKLEALGYDVSVYDGATQAVAGLKAKAVDLIILDLIMPEMDGLTFVTTLRSTPEYAKMPVLMVTTRSVKDDILEA